MSLTAFIFQIGELFKGNINRPGLYHLFLFLLMGAILVGFSVFLGYKAFKSKDK
jgi:hypothetical protein